MNRKGSPRTGEADEVIPDSVANDWARAVVDGARTEGDADGGGPVDGEVVDDEVAEVPEVAEVVDTEVVDAEVVDDEVIDAEVADDEVVDAGSAGAEVLDVEALSVEDLVVDLERVTAERDRYLDASRRLQAEFENYKKQIGKRQVESQERANESLVNELLPVLDAFDGAVASGADDMVPMRGSLLDALTKQGLERIDPTEAPFDPSLHEAVMHDEDDDVDGPVVAEVMRAGYLWKGRVLRPAMVRTRG